MAIYEQINGHLINIRSVLVDDAPFIVGIRNNDKLNKFINPVDKSIKLQRCWIEEQNKRANDYYFIIEDKSKVPLGTISLYKIDERFTSKIARKAILASGVKKKERKNKSLVDEVKEPVVSTIP